MTEARRQSTVRPRELLAREGQALRSLARALAQDEHEAEDLVQDAWVAALCRPATRVSSPGSWLRAVLRNLASNRRRGDSRRRERETDRALSADDARCGDDGQSAEDDRAATLLAVTQAVTALDEPYRRTVIARWFEGLPPRSIAEREGIRVSTVKSRLARAHERLRQTLSRELGTESRDGPGQDWKRSLGLLVGLDLSLPPLALAPGAEADAGTGASPPDIAPTHLLASPNPASGTPYAAAPGITATLLPLAAMSLKTPLASAAFLLAALGASLWHLREGEPALPQAVVSTAATPDSARLIDPVLDPLPSGARESLARGPAALDSVAPPLREHELELHGFVRDADDLPLAGSRIFLAPRGGAFNLATHTDRNGRFALRIAAKQSTLDILFAAQSEDGQNCSDFVSLTLSAGRPFEIDVSVAIGAESMQWISAIEGTLQAELHEDGMVSTGIAFRIAAAPSNPVLDAALPMDFDEEGLGRFNGTRNDPICPGASYDLQARSDVLLTMEGLASASVLAEAEYRMTFDVYRDANSADLLAESPQMAALEGVLQDESGKPLADASVAALVPGRDAGQLGSVLVQTRTDAAGRYVLEGIRPGPTLLVAGGGGFGTAQQELTLAAGDRLPWDPALDRGRELFGRLLDERGEPLADWLVQVVEESPGRQFLKRARTNANGVFGFANLPHGALSMLVRPASGAKIPVVLLEGIGANGDLGDLTFPDRMELGGELSLTVLTHLGEVDFVSSARLESRSTGRALHLTRSGETGILQAEKLPPGAYRVLVFSPSGAVLELEDLQIDAFGELDLGEVAFPEPAELRFFVEDESVDVEELPELAVWRDERTHRSRQRSPVPNDAFGVPVAAGRYRIALGEQTLAARLAPGERLRVLLGDDQILRTQATPEEIVDPPVPESLGSPSCLTCHSAPEPISGAQVLDAAGLTVPGGRVTIR